MKVYIYKPVGTQFADDWLYAAYQGFIALGASISFFDNIENVPYAPDNVVVAYIEDTKKYFELNNICYPKPLNIPDALSAPSIVGRKLNRSIDFALVKTIVDISETDKIFIKPAISVKGFIAGVCTREQLSTLLDIPAETRVFVSEVIEMKSEYRCFVYKNKLVGIKHYSGDFKLFPDMGRVNLFIDKMSRWTHVPVSYSLDVALTDDDHKTIVVECNDFWSICNYGLDPIIYAKMLRDRWFQLTGYRTQFN